jgi:hypothetical protein
MNREGQLSTAYLRIKFPRDSDATIKESFYSYIQRFKGINKNIISRKF